MSTNSDNVTYIYKGTTVQTLIKAAGAFDYFATLTLPNLINGVAINWGTSDPQLDYYVKNYDRFKVVWMEQLYVPSCRGAPNTGMGPAPTTNNYLAQQPEIMVYKDRDGYRGDEVVMDWDTMSRTKNVFYRAPNKPFKIGMKPVTLTGIGQWSGGSAVSSSTFKYVGATPYEGWLDTTDIMTTILGKNPMVFGAWYIKTRPGGWGVDISYLVYSKVIFLFSGRKAPSTT